jgi:hypothetical protein
MQRWKGGPQALLWMKSWENKNVSLNRLPSIYNDQALQVRQLMVMAVFS